VVIEGNDAAEVEQGTARLLLVDDDLVSSTILAAGLRNAGYVVTLASSGAHALESIEQSPFDLAVLDVNMPGIDGLEVARLLHARRPVPFLFLSGRDEIDLVRVAAQQGALGYLLKPLQPQQLALAVEAALIRGREIAELRDGQSRLGASLAHEQKTSMAVGVLMERERVDRKRAMELLRSRARSQRRRISDVAHDILEAAEILNGGSARRD
jgi:AmiR/NasT family two-component response regulator